MNFRNRPFRWGIPLFLSFTCLAGCIDPPTAKKEKKKGVIGQKTQEIGEFDPDGDGDIADLQVKNSANPMAALGAYTYAVGTFNSQQVDRLVDMFEIENDRYPRDHEEFMREIIQKWDVKLDVLPGKRRYQYDVQNHRLVVVEAEK